MTLAFCLLAALAPDASLLKTRVIEASVFRPGLALVLREATIPTGSGAYHLDVVPEAYEGSLWLSSPEGAKVGDLTTDLVFEDRTDKLKARAIGDYLLGNVGKHVQLSVDPNYSTKDKLDVSGTILDVGPPPNGTVTIRQDDGKLRTIPVTSVSTLDPTGLSDTVEFKTTVPKILVKFTAEANKPSKVTFLSLESTAAWESNNLVVLDKGTTATIVTRAQLVVSGLELKDSQIHLLTGVPNLTATNRYDLATGIESLVDHLQTFEQSAGRNVRPENIDPYAKLAALLAKLESNPAGRLYSSYSGTYGGGFSGAGYGGAGGGAFTAPAFNPNQSRTTLTRTEDIYTYDLGAVDLQPGGRLSRVLTDVKVPAARLYAASIDNSGPVVSEIPVRKILRLTNNGTKAWPGGTTMILTETTPLAETDMPFTATRQTVDLNLGGAEDLRVTMSSDETDRKVRQNGLIDVTIRETVNVVNTRDEATKFEIASTQDGEVIEAGGAVVRKLGNQSTYFNPRTLATWNISVATHEKRTFTLVYRKTLPGR